MRSAVDRENPSTAMEHQYRYRVLPDRLKSDCSIQTSNTTNTSRPMPLNHTSKPKAFQPLDFPPYIPLISSSESKDQEPYSLTAFPALSALQLLPTISSASMTGLADSASAHSPSCQFGFAKSLCEKVTDDETDSITEGANILPRDRGSASVVVRRSMSERKSVETERCIV